MKTLSDSEVQVVSGGYFVPAPCCLYSIAATAATSITLAASAIYAGVLQFGSTLYYSDYPSVDVSDMAPKDAYDLGFKDGVAWSTDHQ